MTSSTASPQEISGSTHESVAALGADVVEVMEHGEALPEYPRIAQVMERLRAVSAAADEAADRDRESRSAAMEAEFMAQAATAQAAAIEQHAAVGIFDAPQTSAPAFALPPGSAPAAVAATPVSAGTQPSYADAHVLAQVMSAQASHEVPADHAGAHGQAAAVVGTEVARIEHANMDAVTYDEDGFDVDDYALIQHLNMRETAREALRARMIYYGEARRHYSAYDVVVMMMGFGIMVLLAAPPIVRIVHAIQGTPAAG